MNVYQADITTTKTSWEKEWQGKKLEQSVRNNPMKEKELLFLKIMDLSN